MTNNKKLLSIAIVSAILVGILIIIGMFKYYNAQPNSGNGIFYSQQGDGKYIQFADDKTFSYIYDVSKDASKGESITKNNQVEILSKGTWKKSGGKITLTFEENGGSLSFLETDGYIYREDKIFKGVTSDAKLLKNRYVCKETEDNYKEAVFTSDGTMLYNVMWDGHKDYRWGTYIRVGDILTVRYDDASGIAHRFLVLENGISEDIYSKTEVR